MFRISKDGLDLPQQFNSDDVKSKIENLGIKVGFDVLSYDEDNYIVFHSPLELNNALADLSNDHYEAFKKVYAENEDIHEVIEMDIIEKITITLMISLSLNSKKHFTDLSDYVEFYFTTQYEDEKLKTLHDKCSTLDGSEVQAKTPFSYDEMYNFWQDEKSKWQDLTEDNLISMINALNFRIYSNKDGYVVEDIDQANLGDIESETFTTIEEICERLDHYFEDYFSEY